MIAGQNVLALIPARGGSKGLPGKNIAPVAGRPLLAWTVDAARGSRHIDRTVLSSDDEDIIATAAGLGLEVPFRRRAELARDDTPSIDVVLDALDRLPGYGIVVLLQPTSPRRTAADIDAALERMQAAGAPAVVSLRAAEDHPAWTFRLGADGRLLRYVDDAQLAAATRRQDLPPAWCLNGAVYAARVDWLRRTRSFVAEGTVGSEMPAERSLDIDTAEDLRRFAAAVAAG
ncbi:MAG TPA: acylneuraminate cytidylyltransferase family protein [Methylibium sp.]|nr:acylneuraminate cytidylyltransferase family protein [Methylibium sp.]